MSRLLVLGMGNSIVSDDRIGLHIVERLRAIITNPQIELKTIETGGLSVLDAVTGFDSAIVIDGIKTGKREPGEIIQFTPQQFHPAPRGKAVHDMSFFDAVELGRRMKMKVPERIEMLAIEVADNVTVSEIISPEVLRAVEPVVEKVKALIRDMGLTV